MIMSCPEPDGSLRKLLMGITVGRLDAAGFTTSEREALFYRLPFMLCL